MEEISFFEIRKRIAMFLDNDMNTDDQEKFINEVKQHPAIENDLNRDRAIRERLKASVTRPNISQDLVDKIKGKIGF